MRYGHAFTSEHAGAGTPVILRAECECGQLIITAAPTVAAARRKAGRVLRHHVRFANAAGKAEP